MWDVAGALGELCAQLVRRRAESDEASVDVTPQTLVEMLGAHGRRRLRERGSTEPLELALPPTPAAGNVVERPSRFGCGTSRTGPSDARTT